jgi:hypothetical protein
VWLILRITPSLLSVWFPDVLELMHS